MDLEYVVKKLWWENASEISKSCENILKDLNDWKKQVIVVSAMRSSDFNTTDKLILIWKTLQNINPSPNLLEKQIEEIEKFHIDLIREQWFSLDKNVSECLDKEFSNFKFHINKYLEERDNYIQKPHSYNDYTLFFQNWAIYSLLAFWEVLSCRLFASALKKYLPDLYSSEGINLSFVMHFWESSWKTEWEVFDILAERVSAMVDSKEKQKIIPILSWYIGSFGKWIESAIWRGYTDATAAICSVWLARKGYKTVLEIQKSVKGFLSADPRILENPKSAVLIPELDYLIAREITWDTWARAKLLHPQALRSEVQESWVKIHLFDPFSWNSGSWVLDKEFCKLPTSDCKWISFIWWRENVIFLSVSSGKMFSEWILAKLFTIVKNYFSVDIVSASETEISFTIDWKDVSDVFLQRMIEEIKNAFLMKENTLTEFICYKKEKALIFCVWEHMKNRIWLMWKVTQVLAENNINIEIASQWVLQRSIIFWIDSKDLKKAINVLHTEFIS